MKLLLRDTIKCVASPEQLLIYPIWQVQILKILFFTNISNVYPYASGFVFLFERMDRETLNIVRASKMWLLENTEVVLLLMLKKQLYNFMTQILGTICQNSKKWRIRKSHFQFPKSILIGLCMCWQNNWLMLRSQSKEWANRIRLMKTYSHYNREKTLRIHNVLGQIIRSVINEQLELMKVFLYV